MKSLQLKVLSVLFLCSLYIVSAQTKLYVHPDGDNYARNTKSLAILPLDVQVK